MCNADGVFWDKSSREKGLEEDSFVTKLEKRGFMKNVFPVPFGKN